MTSADAIIVGGGVVGAAIAHRLAVAGVGRVVVCEQGRAGTQGATSRSGGLIRLHHTARCDTELAARSMPFFEHWDELVGGDCGYRRTGFLMLVGEKQRTALHANTAAVQEVAGHRRAEVITPERVQEMHPALSVTGVAAAAYEPDAGYADPVRATASLLDAARRRGAEVMEGVRVERVLERGGMVTGVETSAGRVDSPLVVLAGGAWGTTPAVNLGVHVPVTARRIGLAQVSLPGAGRHGADTALPICIDDTTGSYFRPDGPDHLYFGVRSNPDVELDRDVAPLTPDETAAALDAVRRRVHAAARAPLTGARAGLDGYTPDRRPAIGPGGPDGLYLAVGFSGGGFKTAPAVAELAACEITEGGAVLGKSPQSLLEPYRPQRFTENRPIVPEAPYAHM